MLSTDALLDILTCPDCEAPLSSLDQCGACGLAFGKDGHAPALFAKNRKRQVSFEIAPQNTNPSLIDLQSVFTYPDQYGQKKDGPYHLDRAHADKMATMPKSSLVLEIGCGGGQMRQWVEKLGLRYLGTDISCTRVRDWLQEFGGPDILSDVHFLPVKTASIDAVYSAAVTEHLASPFLAAQEVFRALKPGGFYFGNVSFMEPWHDESFFHMSPLGVFELLRQAGFDAEFIWPQPDYLGYQALMRMGNKGTQLVSGLGAVMSRWYDFALYARDLAKRKRPSKAQDLIYDHGRVTGAMTWIARKPLETMQ